MSETRIIYVINFFGAKAALHECHVTERPKTFRVQKYHTLTGYNYVDKIVHKERGHWFYTYVEAMEWLVMEAKSNVEACKESVVRAEAKLCDLEAMLVEATGKNG